MSRAPRRSSRRSAPRVALLPADLLQRIAERRQGPRRARRRGLPPVAERAAERGDRPLLEPPRRRLGELPRGASGAPRGRPRRRRVTRERWLLVLFDELGYGRLQTATRGRDRGQGVPGLARLGARADPPRRLQRPARPPHAGVAGAADAEPARARPGAPEPLRRAPLGLRLERPAAAVLRDNSSLTRQAYVEFDLEADVRRRGLRRLRRCSGSSATQSRVEGERPHECWLERWSQEAAEAGHARARQPPRRRRGGDRGARRAASSPTRRTPSCATALRAGELTTQDYYRQLLRLVYRLLFLFVAEDRELLLDPTRAERRARALRALLLDRAPAPARRAPARHASTPTSTQALQARHARRSATTTAAPSSACPRSAASSGRRRRSRTSTTPSSRTRDLLDAVRALAFVDERQGAARGRLPQPRRRGARLGLRVAARAPPRARTPTPARSRSTTAAGNERKTTGSYYTPTSLISVPARLGARSGARRGGREAASERRSST